MFLLHHCSLSIIELFSGLTVMRWRFGLVVMHWSRSSYSYSMLGLDWWPF